MEAINLEQFLTLISNFDSQQLVTYNDKNKVIPNYIDEFSCGMKISLSWGLNYMDGTYCTEYKDYIVMEVSGDTDFVYFYNKHFQYITHRYTNDWDWSNCILDIDQRHVDTVLVKK